MPSGASAAGWSPGSDDGRPEREKMTNNMEFMEKLERQKAEAKAAYIQALDEWSNTRSAGNINGDFEKWKTLCEKKRTCMLLGVLI